MQQRYYDPVIGRFYSNDPVGFKTNNPITFNRYAYGNNNPYKYIDPDGRATVGGYRVGVMDFSSWKDELKKSPVGKAWEGGDAAVKAIPQEVANGAIKSASAVLKDGEGVKAEGCAGLHIGACGSITVTNKSVIVSKGLGRVYGASAGIGYVPINADKNDKTSSWSSGVGTPYFFSIGQELELSSGATPQLDLMIGLTGGWSINHTLMEHTVIEEKSQ